MIEQILQEIRNYYIVDGGWASKVDADGLIVNDAGIYMPGAYVWVVGSVINDGVYKVIGIEGNKLTVDGSLQAEMIERRYRVYLLGIPKAVLDLAEEIMAYNDKNASGVKSESLGDYSVSYGGSAEDGSWVSVFKKRLAPYRKAYLNLPTHVRW